MKEKPMPEHVSAEVVEATWKRMAQTPVSRVPALVNLFKKEQPVIMVHFSAPDETLFKLYEKEFIFYVGMVSWQMMRHYKSRLRRVTMKTLEAAMDENYNRLDQLLEDTEADFFSATQFLVEDCREPEVLRYIVETIMEEDEDPEEPGIRDELKGMAFVHLKIGLDAMIKSLR